jgi:hypothetical protein
VLPSRLILFDQVRKFLKTRTKSSIPKVSISKDSTSKNASGKSFRENKDEVTVAREQWHK